MVSVEGLLYFYLVKPFTNPVTAVIYVLAIVGCIAYIIYKLGGASLGSGGGDDGF